MTPRSNGIYLREDEITTALTLRKTYDGTIESLTAGIAFEWIDDWPDPHGVYFKIHARKHIWLPHSTQFQELCSYSHEWHHAQFMPDIRLYDRSPIEIARWEGKASAFAAIVAMPELNYLDADHVRRAFGEHFPHCAHYRIKHFEKFGW